MARMKRKEAHIRCQASSAMRSTREGLTSVRLVIEKKAPFHPFTLVGQSQKAMHGDST